MEFFNGLIGPSLRKAAARRECACVCVLCARE